MRPPISAAVVLVAAAMLASSVRSSAKTIWILNQIRNITMEQVDEHEPVENIRAFVSNATLIPVAQVFLAKLPGYVLSEDLIDGKRLSDYYSEQQQDLLNPLEIYYLPIPEGGVRFLQIEWIHEQLSHSQVQSTIAAPMRSTVGQIKAKLASEYPVQVAGKHLYLNNLRLLDERRLIDYKIYMVAHLKLLSA